MNTPIDFPTSAKGAWTIDIPCSVPTRLFLTERSRTPEGVWLVNSDGTVTDEMAHFAKVLTLDLEQEMPDRLEEKLNALAAVSGIAFRMNFPPTGEMQLMKGQVSAIANLLLYRGAFMMENTPDSRIKDPGNVWSVDVLNPYSHHVFSINISEPVIDGRRRPDSIWLTGDYPEILDGLCALLAVDMAGKDLQRIAIKIRACLEFSFTSDGVQEFRLNSLSAYIAYILLNRYVAHYYMDSSVNVLPQNSNVLSFENNPANARGYEHLLQMF